jgi:8-oxo-dGTP pyrophosphatase MutT (NUDIX family)
MARIDHYHEPDAPKANSIVVAATVFVQDNQGCVLLIQRTDNGLWAIPGGGQEVGEFIAETAVREVREETGIDVEVTGIVGVYSDPRHVAEYTNGEVRQQFSICFRARYQAGRPTPSDESTAVRWVRRDELDELDIHPSVRLRVEHGYDRHDPYIG